jgi:hypothetical protein
MSQKTIAKRILDVIGYGLVACSLLACSAQRHIQKAEKHKAKAIAKGAVFTPDTIQGDRDTTIITYWKDSILHIDRTITDTVYLEGEVRYITRKDKRKEKREEKKEQKRKEKIEDDQREHEQKVEKITARREHKKGLGWGWVIASWLLIFVIGFILGWKLKSNNKNEQ